MTIECINNESRFFQDVKTLGKRNSATLGFMPEGGFEDHAQNKWIIVACIDDTLCGYLMFREVPRYSRVSIVHLCIDENHIIEIELLKYVSLAKSLERRTKKSTLTVRLDYNSV